MDKKYSLINGLNLAPGTKKLRKITNPNNAFTKVNNTLNQRNKKRVNTLRINKRGLFVDKMIQHRSFETITPGVLTVSTYDKFPPLAYQEETADGKKVWKGLDVDFIRAFAKFVGLKPKFVLETEFRGIWDKPKNRESDLSISGIANSFGPKGPRGGPETEWTLPYFYVNRSVILRKGTKFPSAHLTIAATDGSTGWDDGKARGVEGMGHLIKAEDDNIDFEKLRKAKTTKNGFHAGYEINAIMHGDDVSRALIRRNAEKYIKTHGSMDGYDLTMTSWEIVPTLIPKDGEIFAFPTRLGSGLAQILSAFIIRSVYNGFLEELVAKYHMDLDHFVDERKIPTGEYNPFNISGRPLYTQDPEINQKILKLLNSKERLDDAKNYIVGSLKGVKDDSSVRDRFLPQIQNLNACDPYLLTYYISEKLIKPGHFTTMLNGSFDLETEVPEEDKFLPNEFRYISIKYGKLSRALNQAFFYDPKLQTLTIDCKEFMSEIRTDIEQQSTDSEKISVYDSNAQKLAKKVFAEILFKNSKDVSLTPQIVYDKLFGE